MDRQFHRDLTERMVTVGDYGFSGIIQWVIAILAVTALGMGTAFMEENLAAGVGFANFGALLLVVHAIQRYNIEKRSWVRRAESLRWFFAAWYYLAMGVFIGHGINTYRLLLTHGAV